MGEAEVPGAMKLKTRVFELSKGKFKNVKELALAMGIPRHIIYRVRKGERPINQTFIIGALKAFPGYKLDDLFYAIPDGSEVTDGTNDLREKENLVSAGQPIDARRDEIVKLRNAGLTYSEIGSRFGISKERVRQIQKGNFTRRKLDLSSESMLTIREVAQFLNLHINTVRRWDNRGILRSYRISHRGDRRFRREDVDAFLKAREIG